MLTIRGATLAAMACAARLAKLGHGVELWADDDLGGRWATTHEDLPPVVTLPATWRDLFRKSGRTLDAELSREGLAMVEAPAPTHLFPDGADLTLPTERGRQFAVLSERYGQAVAERWRDTLDDLDDVWLAARRFGVENPAAPRTTADRRALALDRTLADVADRAGHPHLAQIVLSQAAIAGTGSRRAPALLASRLVVERTFGRWQLVDQSGVGQSATRLIDLLEARLATRKVRIVREGGAQTDVDCRPLRPWAVRAAVAPHSATIWDEPGSGETALSQVVDHTGSAPVITWRRPTPDGVAQLTWDFTRGHRDRAWGLEPSSARAMLHRPLIVGPALTASACSPAGPEPWAELASAALAVYELHERLTGEDCRPTNRSR